VPYGRCSACASVAANSTTSAQYTCTLMFCVGHGVRVCTRVYVYVQLQAKADAVIPDASIVEREKEAHDRVSLCI
jgi:hypothetical protein